MKKLKTNQEKNIELFSQAPMKKPLGWNLLIMKKMLRYLR